MLRNLEISKMSWCLCALVSEKRCGRRLELFFQNTTCTRRTFVCFLYSEFLEYSNAYICNCAYKNHINNEFLDHNFKLKQQVSGLKS